MLFKNQFRHVNFYSMPKSILFTFRKRINFIAVTITMLLLATWTLI